MFSKVIGVLICIAAILGGIAVWSFMFITGIVGLAEALTSTPIDGSDVGWNIVKILFAEMAGGALALIGVFWGLAIASLGDR